MKPIRFVPIAIVLGLLLQAVLYPAIVDAASWFVAEGGEGHGTRANPFGRLQDALGVAEPGDVIALEPGTYKGSVRTVRGGTPTAPITVRAAGASQDRPAILTAAGTVLQVGHPHVVIDGIVVDGQYGAGRTLDIRDAADFFVLRNTEVRRSGLDCVRVRATRGVRIEDSVIHHCLNSTGGRRDAHGIVAGAARDLTISRTDIHTFSGDGVQLDPSRAAPGWNNVLIEECRFWLAPLEQAENGFPVGSVPGENAVDTKTWNDAPRATIVIRDTQAWGFRGAIANQAAFNLKENIDATVDGATVWDSEIAFRLRGPTSARPAGARVLVRHADVHDVETAVRYEDDIEELRVWDSSFGPAVTRSFQAAAARRSRPDIRNLVEKSEEE